jgi:hypothetical protein
MISAGSTSSPAPIKADVIIRYQNSHDVVVAARKGKAEKAFQSLKAALDYCEEMRPRNGRRVAVTDASGRLIGDLFL